MKPCAACSHPERLSLEEALDRGEPYRLLSRRFGVSIGALKRHRKHPARAEDGTSSAGDEPVYLRFGNLPPSGASRDFGFKEEEEGLSVFCGRRTSKGVYVIDVPFDRRASEASFYPYPAHLIDTMVQLIMYGRPVYVASGVELPERGGDGEPLLSDVSLAAVPPFVRVELPEWLGGPGEKFADAWNRWRRALGAGLVRDGGPRYVGESPLAPASMVGLGAEILREAYRVTARLGGASAWELQNAEAVVAQRRGLLRDIRNREAGL